jgi:hypothetical protein
MVSRNRPQTSDRRGKIASPDKAREVGLAMIHYEGPNAAYCSCGGFGTTHARPKVVEDRIDRHINRKHQGRGIRL